MTTLAAAFSMAAEDLRSFAESWPYMIRIGDAAEPIICECCGTPVAFVPEALCADGPDRRYAPGIWETGTWRRHTLRRCAWRRGLASC